MWEPANTYIDIFQDNLDSSGKGQSRISNEAEWFKGLTEDLNGHNDKIGFPPFTINEVEQALYTAQGHIDVGNTFGYQLGLKAVRKKRALQESRQSQSLSDIFWSEG